MDKQRRSVLSLVVCSGALMCSNRTHAVTGLGAYIATNTQTVRYALKVHNPTDRILKKAWVQVIIPAQVGLWHRRQGIETAPRAQVIEPFAGNQIVRFELAQLAPYAQQIMHITVTVDLADRQHTLTLPAPNAYLEAEPLIEVQDPVVQARAAQLKRASARQTIEAIYQWVHAHIRDSGYEPRAQGARAALLHAHGDCTEYAYLTVALVRAAGYPARVVSGFVLNGTTRLRAIDYHDWCEVFVEKQWWLIDAQKGLFHPTQNPGYVAFEYLAAQPEAGKPASQRFSASEPLKVTWL